MKILTPMCQLLDVSSPNCSVSGHWELQRTPGHNDQQYRAYVDVDVLLYNPSSGSLDNIEISLEFSEDVRMG